VVGFLPLCLNPRLMGSNSTDCPVTQRDSSLSVGPRFRCGPRVAKITVCQGLWAGFDSVLPWIEALGEVPSDEGSEIETEFPTDKDSISEPSYGGGGGYRPCRRQEIEAPLPACGGTPPEGDLSRFVSDGLGLCCARQRRILSVSSKEAPLCVLIS
jgi:hypothetical protein